MPTSASLPLRFSEQLPELVSSIVPESRLPTLDALAQLAAVMASTEENPADTATRALVLWKACSSQLANTFISQSLTKPFLDGFPLGQSITIPAFLEKCIPKSTDRTRLKRWCAFVENREGKDTIRVIFGPNDKEVVSATSASEIAGIIIPHEHLVMFHDFFVGFLTQDKKLQTSERTKKSLGVKTLRKAARALLAGITLKEIQKAVFIKMSSKERAELLDGMKLSLRDRQMLKSGINDLHFAEPKAPRTRVVKTRRQGETP